MPVISSKEGSRAFRDYESFLTGPEWRVSFITASRRSLRDIELQTGAISTFDLIFHKHYLAMFNEQDLEEYFTRISSVGIEVTPVMKERIDYYCGGSPLPVGKCSVTK